MIDKKIQEVADFLLSNVAMWHTLDNYILGDKTMKLSASHFRWYYAEDELYVIKDVQFKAFYFIKANNPKRAFEKFYNTSGKGGTNEND